MEAGTGCSPPIRWKPRPEKRMFQAVFKKAGGASRRAGPVLKTVGGAGKNGDKAGTACYVGFNGEADVREHVPYLGERAGGRAPHAERAVMFTGVQGLRLLVRRGACDDPGKGRAMRVIPVDDESLLRQPLCERGERHPEIVVVGEADEVQSAAELVAVTKFEGAFFLNSALATTANAD